MKKQLSLIVLSFTMISLVIAGSWGLDILINGKHLPLSRERIQKMRADINFELWQSDYPEKTDEETRLTFEKSNATDQVKIKETLSFLKNSVTNPLNMRIVTTDRITRCCTVSISPINTTKKLSFSILMLSSASILLPIPMRLSTSQKTLKSSENKSTGLPKLFSERKATDHLKGG